MENRIADRTGRGTGAERPWIAALGWAAAVIIACAAFLAFFLWALPAWLTLRPHLAGATRDQAINNARLGIAAILAVLGTAGGLAYTVRTYRLSRQGQIADQYTKAIEQLSNASTVIRMGGIYALEQTTRQSQEYRQTVIDVLAAFIRLQPAGRPHSGPQPSVLRSEHLAGQAEPLSPEADVRVALAVLRSLVRLVGKRDLDLTYSDLSGGDLMGMYLLDARLNGANLTGAKLNGAYLAGADLQGALLKDAQFYNADFTDVRLWRSQISPAELNADNVTGLGSVQWLEPPEAPDALQPATPGSSPPDRRGTSRRRRPHRNGDATSTLPRSEGGSAPGEAKE